MEETMMSRSDSIMELMENDLIIELIRVILKEDIEIDKDCGVNKIIDEYLLTYMQECEGGGINMNDIRVHIAHKFRDIIKFFTSHQMLVTTDKDRNFIGNTIDEISVFCKYTPNATGVYEVKKYQNDIIDSAPLYDTFKICREVSGYEEIPKINEDFKY